MLSLCIKNERITYNVEFYITILSVRVINDPDVTQNHLLMTRVSENSAMATRGQMKKDVDI